MTEAPPHPDRTVDDDGAAAGLSDSRIESELRAIARKLDRLMEANDRGLAIGRELVEQKAENLDLKRQIHRLEEELRFLKAGGVNALAQQGAMDDLSISSSNGAVRGSRSLRRKLLRLFGRAE